MIGKDLILAYAKENKYYFSEGKEDIYIEDVDLMDDVVHVAFNVEGKTDSIGIMLLDLLEFVYKSNKGDDDV
jgi:hypothetical protein